METSLSQQTSQTQRTILRTLITCRSYCFHLFTWTIRRPRPRLLLFCTILPYCSTDDTPSSNHNHEEEATLRRAGLATMRIGHAAPLLLSFDFTLSISWHLAQHSLPSPKVGDNRTRLTTLETQLFDLDFDTK